MTDAELPEPDVPALTAWHEAHPYRRGVDTPTTRLWFPDQAPYATLQTISRGCELPDVLADPARPMVDVHLGSYVQVGGYLEDMEAYFAAALDAIKLARWQADNIAARMTVEAPR